MRSLVIVSILALVACTTAEFGECRFGTDGCSCKMGSANEGVCWDFIPGTTDCEARTCKAGWTCTCRDRTHVCHLETHKSVVNKGQAVSLQAVAEAQTAGERLKSQCDYQENTSSGNSYLKLGEIHFALSEKGVLANACNQFAWFINGKLMGVYPKPTSLRPELYSTEYDQRSNHYLLELRPGDLIAFRFKDASYHCYKQLTILDVNGTATSSAALGFDTRFAREWSSNWEKKTFVPVLREEERDDNMRAFVPLRKYTLPLTPGSSDVNKVVPGEDMWQPSTGPYADDPNHRLSNFYYRMKVPVNL